MARAEHLSPFSGVLRAAWLFTGDTLVRNGGLVVKEGKIERFLQGGEKLPASGSENVRDYPDGLIHPALVNAHCHLDLSGLEGKVAPDDDFVAWLRTVRDSRAADGEEALRKMTRDGLGELLASGVTAVVDFSFDALSFETLRDSPVRALILREVLGFDEEKATGALAAASAWLEGVSESESLRSGLAPHAPYSASSNLIRQCHRLCRARGAPFSIHVAEDPAERVFLETGGGPFRELLESLGLSLADFNPPGKSPVSYLDDLGVIDRDSLLVHANDLDDNDIEILRSRGASVVFCPGTHAYFSRPRHRLRELLAAGVPVALGTDSSASNSGLSMVREMGVVRRLFPDLSAETVFGLGTGKALGWIFPGAGRLREAAPADLVVSDLVSGTEDPLESFLRGEATTRLSLGSGVPLAER